MRRRSAIGATLIPLTATTIALPACGDRKPIPKIEPARGPTVFAHVSAHPTRQTSVRIRCQVPGDAAVLAAWPYGDANPRADGLVSKTPSERSHVAVPVEEWVLRTEELRCIALHVPRLHLSASEGR